MLTLRTITREPAATFAAMENRLNQLFNETLGAWDGRRGEGVAMAWAPPVDVFEHADGIRITAEIPGVKPDQVSISVEGNTLTLRGAKEGGAFERRFTIPATVDAAGITAAYEYGVLTLTLPKAEQAKPRQIPVAVAKS